MKEKLKRKAEVLKMLADDMADCMPMGHEMGEEVPMKATIMAEDEEGLREGAKKLPEILKKSEKIRKKLKV